MHMHTPHAHVLDNGGVLEELLKDIADKRHRIMIYMSLLLATLFGARAMEHVS